jgi:hypothetical protein
MQFLEWGKAWLRKRQIHAGDRHCGDAFFAPNEPEKFIGGSFNPDLPSLDPQRLRNIGFHMLDVWEDLGSLSDDCGINVNQFAVTQNRQASRFMQKDLAGSSTPSGVGVGKKMSDIRLAESAENGIANRVH